MKFCLMLHLYLYVSIVECGRYLMKEVAGKGIWTLNNQE
jgi:hypothetical protein